MCVCVTVVVAFVVVPGGLCGGVKQDVLAVVSLLGQGRCIGDALDQAIWVGAGD